MFLKFNFFTEDLIKILKKNGIFLFYFCSTLWMKFSVFPKLDIIFRNGSILPFWNLRPQSLFWQNRKFLKVASFWYNCTKMWKFNKWKYVFSCNYDIIFSSFCDEESIVADMRKLNIKKGLVLFSALEVWKVN